ncbi:hypothetical protein Abr02nite_71550 [Paractinoplanes brasiliensis]|nr:hypothetical protein Abr02nite_71550 [Actinoplanes brasiliensis]
MSVAAICGALDLALGFVLAAAYGSEAMVAVGGTAAFGTAIALVVDHRRNPQWMTLRAFYRERTAVLFQSRQKQEFEQVRRAVVRAVEANFGLSAK